MRGGDHMQRRAALPGEEDVEHRDVEGDLPEARDAITRTDREQVAAGRQEGGDGPNRHHHPLGDSGRSRSEHDVSRVLRWDGAWGVARIVRRERRGAGDLLTLGGRRQAGREEARRRAQPRRQERQVPAIDDDCLRLDGLEHLREPRLGERRVDGDVGAAGPAGAQDPEIGLEAAAGEDGDGADGSVCRVGQPARHLLRRPSKLAVAERAPLDVQGGGLGVLLGGSVDAPGEVGGGARAGSPRRFLHQSLTPTEDGFVGWSIRRACWVTSVTPLHGITTRQWGRSLSFEEDRR